MNCSICSSKVESFFDLDILLYFPSVVAVVAAIVAVRTQTEQKPDGSSVV